MKEFMRNLHFSLFIGIMCVTQMMAQDCPYSHPACQCFLGSVKCKGLQQIPPVNPQVTVALLIFRDGNITSISKRSLPARLSVIYLINHPLTNISDDAFDSSAATLQYVHFEGAKFSSLPTALKILTSLKYLTVLDTRLRVWDTAVMNQIAKNCLVLELKNVSLSRWPTWISGFRSVVNIDLSWNSLNHIPADAFNFVKDSLLYLQLSGCRLNQVPQALSTLSSLSKLDLSYNTLRDVSQLQIITRAPFARKLSILMLDSTRLIGVANFQNLTTLRAFSLSGNRISDLPINSLPSSLEELDISDNRLSSVPAAVAFSPNLKILNLTRNRIQVVKPSSFPLSLENLDMISNKLTMITNKTFKRLNRLSFLALDSNPISKISRAAFSDLVSLSYLSLSDLNLAKFPLALTRLSPQTAIHFTTSQSLACPCPVPRSLVKWFSSLRDIGNIQVKCSTGQSLITHLGGQCGKP